MIPGTDRGLAALSYAERTTLKQRWKQTCLTPQKLEGLPRGILSPKTLQNLLLDIELPSRDKSQLQQPEHRHKAPPTRKTSQDTNPTPSTGTDSMAKNYDLINI